MATVYEVSSIKKLIDLNGSSINFNIDVKIASEGGAQFEAVVINQKELDSGDPIRYQPSQNGTFGAKITNRSNSFNNYYLVLKATTPCKCSVEVTKEELPMLALPMSTAEPVSAVIQANPQRMYLIGIGLLLILVGGYFYYTSTPEVPTKRSSRPPDSDLFNRLNSLV